MRASRRYCENEAANTVLSSKAAYMEALEIRFDCRAEIPANLPIGDPDLCAVLANSLGNAIEACAKLPAEQRRINLHAGVGKGMFALEVQNPSPAPPADQERPDHLR